MSGSTNRIVLGTVQFGLTYGVANAVGQVDHKEARAILTTARASGTDMLDTAVMYGESEATLGLLGVHGWKAITKLPEMPAAVPHPAQWVSAQVECSLARLKIKRLHGLLLHRPAQLLGPHGMALYAALEAERDSGRVGAIGISVYGPEELEALPRAMRFDIVQAPWNVLDQRMTRSGWAQRLQAQGCEFHARSVFLQGLLLMSPEARPHYFSRWSTLFATWDSWLATTHRSPLQACLLHALSAPGIDRIVVGVDSAAHLDQIAAAASATGPAPRLPDALVINDPALLNPALWKA
jgi:aryl-alcohol dehydrogenase-like predicted oxidoreductase